MVHHQDLLTPMLRQSICDDAQPSVHGAARRRIRDDAHRFARIARGLRVGRSAKGYRHKRYRQQPEPCQFQRVSKDRHVLAPCNDARGGRAHFQREVADFKRGLGDMVAKFVARRECDVLTCAMR
jgi:hypothetical protein